MTKAKSDDEIVDIILNESKKIQDILNFTFLTKFAEAHNINPDNNKFFAKQEVVAKRGYFMPVKKKYGLHIVNAEGTPCNKQDIKGMVTRRSDYPAYTKEKIKELLKYILESEKISFKWIRDFIKTEEDIIRMKCINGEKIIAKPVGWKKGLKEYDRIPSQIEGMQLWNSLEYDYFLKGTRGYQYKILGLDPYAVPEKMKNDINLIHGRNNIVLPYEEEKLPEYYKINVDEMIDLAWNRRVQELLAPIWDKIDRRAGLQKKTAATF